MSTQIEIVNKPEFELRRLLFTGSQIKNEFYQKNGILLFQDSAPIKEINEDLITCVLPKNIYSFMQQEFDWESFDEVEWVDCIGMTGDVKKYESLINLFDQSRDLTTIDLDFIESKAHEVAQMHGISDITFRIYPSNLGTRASFCFDKDSNTAHVSIRNDVDKATMVFGLIGGMFHSLTVKIPWESLQEIRRYLLTRTKLSEGIDTSKFEQTTDMSEKIQQYFIESDQNFADLGFVKRESFYMQKDKLFLQDYGEVDFLTKQELSVFDLLFKSKDSTVSYDQIAQILWPNDVSEKYSPTAIAKVIERIRKKIKLTGLNKQVIFTKRGSGYVLID